MFGNFGRTSESRMAFYASKTQLRYAYSALKIKESTRKQLAELVMSEKRTRQKRPIGLIKKRSERVRTKRGRRTERVTRKREEDVRRGKKDVIRG